MSVQSEILRIQSNIANAYATVSSKGGEVPLQPTSANLAAAVQSIPAGGIPAGGTTGQVLAKASNADKDVKWEDSVTMDQVNDAIAEAISGAIQEAYYGTDSEA